MLARATGTPDVARDIEIHAAGTRHKRVNQTLNHSPLDYTISGILGPQTFRLWQIRAILG